MKCEMSRNDQIFETDDQSQNALTLQNYPDIRNKTFTSSSQIPVLRNDRAYYEDIRHKLARGNFTNPLKKSFT